MGEEQSEVFNLKEELPLLLIREAEKNFIPESCNYVLMDSGARSCDDLIKYSEFHPERNCYCILSQICNFYFTS